MSPKEFCHLIAHGAASEFLKHQITCLESEAIGVAILEVAGVRIVVSMTRYDGPAQLHLTPAGAAALDLPRAPPKKLTPLMKQIAALLSPDRPSKVSALAIKLGKRPDSAYFRNLCADLERMGVARHVKGVGYFLVRADDRT